MRMNPFRTKILVVDDDEEIRGIVRILLTGEDYDVIEASCGEEAISCLSPSVDLVILDIMMPRLSGYDICQRIRKESNVPVLFLTAKTQSSDLVLGYATGGDDYLAKPFSYPEFISRVKGLVRRYQTYKGKPDCSGMSQYIERYGIKLDCNHNEVFYNGLELYLTDTEYRLLRLLMKFHGKIFSTQNLYESVWEEPFLASSSNTVMVFIRKLREKIEDDPSHPKILRTIWGRGYRID